MGNGAANQNGIFIKFQWNYIHLQTTTLTIKILETYLFLVMQ